MAVQCVAGHNAAFQRYRLQRRQSGRHLVAIRTGARRERQAGFGIPDTDHQRWQVGAAAFVAAARALAIHRNRALGRTEAKTFAQGGAEATQRFLQLFGIEQTEQPAERIVAGRGIGRQIDDVSELRAVRRSKVSDVDATPRAAQCRCKRKEQQRRQLVLRRMVTRVVDVGEDRQNRFHARCLPKQGTLLRIHVSGVGKRLFLGAICLRQTRGGSFSL
jgi:hypothetical protein